MNLNSWSVCRYGFFWFVSLPLQGMFKIGCGCESAQSCMSGFLDALKQSKQTVPFGWNYKPAEKHCWLIFCERKIIFQLKKQTE
jgi:hypothetical protein